jgi:uncharacterized protein YegL
MRGVPLTELLAGLRQFAEDVREDTLARKRVEVSIISFGGNVQVVTPFTEAQHFEPPQLAAGGATPLGQAILAGMQELTQQKRAYKSAGVEYFRPWLVLMTDGSPTDDTSQAVSKLRRLEAKKGVVVMPIGVGDKADMQFLSSLSAERSPALMRDVSSFAEFFRWLSASLGSVSVSASSASSDEGLAGVAQVPLPSPSGWMSA